MHALHITKSRRTEYDHDMLQLHDRVKADIAYQRDAPQLAIDFAPGTTWVVYSDQVLHAAMGGQLMMEQTFYLEPSSCRRRPARRWPCCNGCSAGRCCSRRRPGATPPIPQAAEAARRLLHWLQPPATRGGAPPAACLCVAQSHAHLICWRCTLH